jgi:starch synthase
VAEIHKVALFTNEYPPNVYGGAGVHVEYLSRALARRIAVEVRCFGEQRGDHANLAVRGYPRWPEAAEGTDPRFAGALDAFHRSLAMAKDTIDADVVHCHTWYTDMGGLIASRLWDVPFVLSIHSLEPLRPWKVEQLGNGYHLSTWMERTAIEQADAIVAVSGETREDVLRLFDVAPERVHVIHNGIDPAEYRPTGAAGALEHRSGEAVSALRRPDHPPEGDHPPGRCHPRDRPGPADRARRRRARHARDRP